MINIYDKLYDSLFTTNSPIRCMFNTDPSKKPEIKHLANVTESDFNLFSNFTFVICYISKQSPVL